jgi:hypothetical protein
MIQEIYSSHTNKYFWAITVFKFVLGGEGTVMAQGVSRRSLTMKAQAQLQVSPGRICGRSGSGKGFSQSPSAFSSHSTSSPHIN